MIFISVIIISLLYQLNSHFKREFELNCRNMIFFFVVETSILAVFVIGSVEGNNDVTTFDMIK